MTDDLDPTIQALFDEAPAPEASPAFQSRVMAALNQQSRRRKLMWFALDLLAVIVIWLASEPLQEFAMAMIPWMMSSLLELGDSLWAQLLAPVNNLASVLALTVLLGRSVYRRLIRS